MKKFKYYISEQTSPVSNQQTSLKSVVLSMNDAMDAYNAVSKNAKDSFKQQGNAVLSGVRLILINLLPILDSDSLNSEDKEYIEKEKENIISNVDEYKKFINDLYGSNPSFQNLLTDVNGYFNLIKNKLKDRISEIAPTKSDTEKIPQIITQLYNELGLE